jgi:1,4-alpha-glucan branching enzyme
LRGRVADQAVREVMLLLASDWPFLIKTGTAPHYAEARFETHLARFRRLELMLASGDIDERWLTDLESRDNIFPHVPLDWMNER